MPDYGWEVMLWDPVTGWSPYGKPSHAAGITVGYNGTAQAFAEQLLNDRARELGNAGGRLRVTVGSYDPAGPPSEILAEAEITRPAKASDRYVVARINKTYRTLGRQPGSQDVGKTFVPYDDRRLSKAAAEESAKNSNDRYRPSLHGKTYIAVRAEPVPGTNKFRNLDHPSLTSKVQAAGRKVSNAAPLDAPAGALIAALRSAPEGNVLWTKEGDAWWIARNAPMDVLLRAGDLLRIPDLDHYSQIALADEVTRAARGPAIAAPVDSTVDFPDEVNLGVSISGRAAPSTPARPSPQATTPAKGAGAR